MFTVKDPETGKFLKIGSSDFSAKMNFNSACKYCSNLGYGWRLPNLYEQIIIYSELHKRGRGNFKNDFYLSSTESFDGTEFGIWVYAFQSGDKYNCLKTTPVNVRAVFGDPLVHLPRHDVNPQDYGF